MGARKLRSTTLGALVVMGTGCSGPDTPIAPRDSVASLTGSLPAVVLIDPAATTGATPSFTWQAVPNADAYQLWVSSLAGVRVNQVLTAAAASCGTGAGACSVTPTVVLEPGAARFWVRAQNQDGNGTWGSGQSFFVSAGTIPAPRSPTGLITDATPAFVWDEVAGASSYELWVDDSTGNVANQTFSSAGVCGSGTCTANIGPGLADGPGTWWVRADGGSWSPGLSFTVGAVPAAPTLISPVGAAVTTEVFTWAAEAVATEYQIWVENAGAVAVNQTITAGAAGCAGGGSCSFDAGGLLAEGLTFWWVRASGSAGWSSWSARATYTQLVPAPVGFVAISAGTFTMGSPPTEVGRGPSDPETQHAVTITQSFWLKATEVTQAEWSALMGTNPSYFTSCGGDCPVERVSWWDAIAFANALSDSEGLERCYVHGPWLCGSPGGGCAPNDTFCDHAQCPLPGLTFVGLGCRGYRLPTEAEWEYAARAGTMTAFHTGDLVFEPCSPLDPNLDAAGWYCGNATGPQDVAGKLPNAWGLFDMHGNLQEWVHDWYGPYPTVNGGPASGPGRIQRGGSWDRGGGSARSASRGWTSPRSRSYEYGFRVARSIVP